MTRPRWLSLDGKAISEIRAQPGFEMLVEWFAWERERAREAVLLAVASPEPPNDPKLRAGLALAMDHIIASLTTPIAIADMDDDTFIDPARRPSRKDSDAEA